MSRYKIDVSIYLYVYIIIFILIYLYMWVVLMKRDVEWIEWLMNGRTKQYSNEIFTQTILIDSCTIHFIDMFMSLRYELSGYMEIVRYSTIWFGCKIGDNFIMVVWFFIDFLDLVILGMVWIGKLKQWCSLYGICDGI